MIKTELLLSLPPELIEQISWWRRLYDMNEKYGRVRHTFDQTSRRGYTPWKKGFRHTWRLIAPNRRISGMLIYALWKGDHAVERLIYDIPFNRTWLK